MTPPKKAAETALAAATVEAQPLPEKGIGGRIREARQDEKNNLNIEALSRMCKLADPAGQGITRTTLVRYESGDVLPGAREIRILCAALNVTADWLVLGKTVGDLEQADKVIGVLSELVRQNLIEREPLWFFGSKGLKEREAMLKKAREPQPRS